MSGRADQIYAQVVEGTANQVNRENRDGAVGGSGGIIQVMGRMKPCLESQDHQDDHEGGRQPHGPREAQHDSQDEAGEEKPARVYRRRRRVGGDGGDRMGCGERIGRGHIRDVVRPCDAPDQQHDEAGARDDVAH